MSGYKKLDVWKKSHERDIFIKKNITVKFPKEERYELTTPLLRAALPVPLNMVEGCGRYTDKDFARFLDNDLGSVNESDYCCFVAWKFNYISKEEFDTANKLLNDVRAMLINFLKYLRENKG